MYLFTNCSNHEIPNHFTEPECCICQELMSSEANRKLNCGHEFHKSCIGEWFKQQKNCPICRRGPTQPSRGQNRGRGGRGRRPHRVLSGS